VPSPVLDPLHSSAANPTFVALATALGRAAVADCAR
jgi:hypothetical protein